MKNSLQLFCLLFFFYSFAHAQCEFENDKFDQFDRIAIVDTKKERIFYTLVTNEALKIAFGNIGLDYYYMTFTPLMSSYWDVNQDGYIKLLLSNDDILELRPEKTVKSIRDEASFAGFRGTTNRQTGNISCPISEHDLDLLYKNDIKEIRIRLSDGNFDFKIKKKNNFKHSYLIECLDKRVSYWKKKYPESSLKQRQLKEETIIKEEAKQKEKKEKLFVSDSIMRIDTNSTTTLIDPTINRDDNKNLNSTQLDDAALIEQNRKKTPPPQFKKEESDDLIFKVVEQMPRFPGCENEPGDNKDKETCAKDKMLTYIYANLKYPILAKAKGITGMCVIQFIIDRDGDVVEAKIVRDIGFGCGEEALRVVNKMNSLPEKWEPGRQRGQNVKVLYTLPVRFNSESSKHK